MEDRQRIREHCASLDDSELVRALTVDRDDHAPVLITEAEGELDRRGLSLEAAIDRISVRVGNAQEATVTIAEAVAMVHADIARRALAVFTHCLGESLLYQREAWGWVVHHYQDDHYGLSYLVYSTDTARSLLDSFLRLGDWVPLAGEGHHLDDWRTLTASEDGEAVLALADRLQAGGVDHVVRSPLFTPEGDSSIALLVPPDRFDEAVEVAGTGRRPIRQLHRQARERDESGDRPGELAVYDELAETDADNPAVHYNRGAVLLDLGRQEEAAADFMRCVASGMERLAPRLEMGGGRSSGGMFGIAARLVGRVAGGPSRHYPDYFDDAELQLEALLPQLGVRKDLLHSLASLSRVKGETEAAVQRYRQVLELDPEDEVARFQLGYLAAAAD